MKGRPEHFEALNRAGDARRVLQDPPPSKDRSVRVVYGAPLDDAASARGRARAREISCAARGEPKRVTRTGTGHPVASDTCGQRTGKPSRARPLLHSSVRSSGVCSSGGGS